MKLFTEWLKTNIQEEQAPTGDISSAVTTLRNHFANGKWYPQDWLLQGVNSAANQIGSSNPQAKALLDVMATQIQRFLQDIRNQQMGIQTAMPGKGYVLRMPGPDDPKSQEYDQMFNHLMRNLSIYVERLAALAQPQGV